MDINVEKIKEIAKNSLSDCPAHNFDHVLRVYNMALKLAENEDVDLEVIKIAALLHDIWGKKEIMDPTWKTDHAIEWAEMSKEILKQLWYSQDFISHVTDCIISHRYRTENKPKTLEAKILFDADKLETIWAIGVARMFCWIWRNNAHIYKKIDVELYAKENLWWKINGRIQDKTLHSPQLMYETKDKYILNYLQTEKAKEIAKERFDFYKMFLDRLEKEVNNEM